jgi:Protein of unknown function (DUF2934)
VPTPSQRNSDPTARKTTGASRRVKKMDAAPTNREIAQEAAAIYPDTFDTPPSPDEIAAEAYFIYCERGCTHGRDIDDWLEAERRLSDRRKSQTSDIREDR